ncbi:MAG: hypothetical protein KZQ76_01725 [Candidatus Thiodiazotropha sp. (ex Epidulcina cf. delphinae)]|nr:hypothetical protein [Candidatus Thiodiazotropha sp. (ex Epidulcina cf. delphinae)]
MAADGVLDVDPAAADITVAPAQVAVGDAEVHLVGLGIVEVAAELVEGFDGGVDDLDLGEALVPHVEAGAGGLEGGVVEQSARRRDPAAITGTATPAFRSSLRWRSNQGLRFLLKAILGSCVSLCLDG